MEDHKQRQTPGTGNAQEENTGKQKNESTSKLIRGSAVLFLGRILAIIMKFFIQILIIRYLPKEEFGAFAYALNMVDIAVIISLVALDKSASRFVPIYDEHQDYDSLFGFMIISLVTIIGMGAGIALFFIGSQELITGTFISNPLVTSLLVIMIVLAPLQALDNWFQSIFAAFSSVQVIFIRRYIVLPLFQLLAILFVLSTKSSVYWLAGGYVLGGVIGTIMYVSLLFSMLRERQILGQFSLRTINFDPKAIFGFSLPMFFTGFVLIVRSQLAVVLLELFKGTIAVAEYRAVEPIIRLNTIVYSSFVFLYLPLASRLYTKGDHEGINDIFWRTSAWIAIVNLPVFFVSFSLARPVVTVLGDDYSSSALIMAIMSVGAYLNSVMGFNKDTLRAYNKVGYLFKVDVIVMVVALSSYFLFIPQYGAIGAALVYTLAHIINNLLYHNGMMKFVGIKGFESKYLPFYILILISAIGLGLLQLTFDLSLWLGLLVAALISLVLLRISAKQLEITEVFPELLRIPVLKKLL